MISRLIGPLLLLVLPVHLHHFDQTKSLMNSITNHFYCEHTCSNFGQQVFDTFTRDLSHPKPPPRRMKGVRDYTRTLYLLFSDIGMPKSYN